MGNTSFDRSVESCFGVLCILQKGMAGFQIKVQSEPRNKKKYETNCLALPLYLQHFSLWLIYTFT